MHSSLSRRFPSPLRYPGGKGKISNYFRLLFLRNGLIGHQYAELYAGGAGLALSLLFDEFASHIHINDINRGVFAFWDAVLNHTEALTRRITDTPVTMDQWRKQRAVQEEAQPEPMDLAFSTFFLNRTNRSGIVWGGAIGGRYQRGDWALDARYNKSDLVRRIEKIARYHTRITLTRLDAAYYLGKRLPLLGSQTFAYLDPPYYVKGKGLYEHYYQHDSHVQIAELVAGLTIPWVVSYDASPELLRMYSRFGRLSYSLSYSAAARYRGSEVMFFSHGLTLPDVPSAANVPLSTVDDLRHASIVGLV